MVKNVKSSSRRGGGKSGSVADAPTSESSASARSVSESSSSQSSVASGSADILPRSGLLWFALFLSFVSVLGLLSYDLWGERWLSFLGRNESSLSPHSHVATDGSVAEHAAEIARLRHRLERLGADFEALSLRYDALAEDVSGEREVLENLRLSLSEQEALLLRQGESLDALRESSLLFRKRVSDSFLRDIDILGHLAILVRERRAAGEPLGDVADLLLAFAGDGADFAGEDVSLVYESLREAGMALRVFTDMPVPTASSLLREYGVLRPQIALAMGGRSFPSIEADRDFFKNLGNYFRSLVRVRRLDEASADDSLRDSEFFRGALGGALLSGNFAEAYGLAESLRGVSPEIDAWLERLSLRVRADGAVMLLHNSLSSYIALRLRSVRENFGE